MRTIAARLKMRTFVEESNDGFVIDRVRDTLIEGRFFEKILLEETIRDPFGNEHNYERLTYREVEFAFSSTYPQVEIRQFPRGLQAFFTRTAEVTEFATTFLPITVDTFAWAEGIHEVYPKEFRIDLAHLADVAIDDQVTAKMIVSGAQDIRSAVTRFINCRDHKVERIQLKMTALDALLSLQLAVDATVRSVDPLPRDVLSTVRQVLPMTRKET
jgi:hypothetical protein